jgi:hypothetical protein
VAAVEGFARVARLAGFSVIAILRRARSPWTSATMRCWFEPKCVACTPTIYRITQPRCQVPRIVATPGGCAEQRPSHLIIAHSCPQARQPRSCCPRARAQAPCVRRPRARRFAGQRVQTNAIPVRAVAARWARSPVTDLAEVVSSLSRRTPALRQPTICRAHPPGKPVRKRAHGRIRVIDNQRQRNCMLWHRAPLQRRREIRLLNISCGCHATAGPALSLPATR